MSNPPLSSYSLPVIFLGPYSLDRTLGGLFRSLLTWWLWLQMVWVRLVDLEIGRLHWV